MPISAAFSTCHGVPPSSSVSPAAAIEHAEPTSPWQPTSAPLIEAFSLMMLPMPAATSRKRTVQSSSAPATKSWK